MTYPDLDTIAHTIADHGTAACTAELRAVVSLATAAGVDPVVVAVLADAGSPEMARARAFGQAATALAAIRPGSEPTGTTDIATDRGELVLAY